MRAWCGSVLDIAVLAGVWLSMNQEDNVMIWPAGTMSPLAPESDVQSKDPKGSFLVLPAISA